MTASDHPQPAKTGGVIRIAEKRPAPLATYVPNERNHPYNCWWVAATSDEIGEGLLSRKILDVQVVMYRMADGQVVALEDRCPHRSLPLSMGKRHGDNLACGYHGFQFEPGGQCVHVPSQTNPGPLAVRSFPTREIGPFIWIYTGDKVKLDDVPPPPMQDWMTDPAYKCKVSYVPIQGNYMLLKENVLDLTHFGYVHAGTFDVPVIKNAPEVVTPDDWSVGYRESFKNIPLNPFMGDPIGLMPDQRVDMGNWGDMLGPAMVQGAIDYFILEPRPGQQQANHFRICHATTPIDSRSMHYWWILGRNFDNSEPSMKAFNELIDFAFRQDKVVIEAVQKVYDADLRAPERVERSVLADRAAIAARRIICRWLEKEQSASQA